MADLTPEERAYDEARLRVSDATDQRIWPFIVAADALRSASREPEAREGHQERVNRWVATARAMGPIRLDEQEMSVDAPIAWRAVHIAADEASGEPAPRRSNPFNEDVLEAIAAWLMRIQHVETLDVAHRREALELRRVLLQGARGEPAPTRTERGGA